MAFRQMRRSNQQISREECISLLKEEWRGVLSVSGDDGYPYGAPMDFYYDEAKGIIYLHGAGEGHKIDSIKKNPKVCFTVWDEGYKEDGDWAFYINSVIVFGKAEIIKAGQAGYEEILRKIGNKYYPSPEDVEEGIKKGGPVTTFIQVNVEHITGKKVHEK